MPEETGKTLIIIIIIIIIIIALYSNKLELV